MDVLVIGGTGTVGSQVVSGLVGRGERPRVLTRSADRIRSLPTNVWGVTGDLARPETLSAAFQGVDRLVLITPLSPDEAREGRNAVAAARAAGVRRLVYLSIHQVEKCPEAPHFASKIEIQKAIEASGIAWTLVMPNNFFQNDDLYREALLGRGLYPQPIGGVGLSRADVRDVASAILAVLGTGDHAGRRYPVVGPDRLTGDETAAIWSRHLGREVRYGGDDLEAWARQAGQTLPEWMVADLRLMYGFFQAKGLAASEADLAAQERLLGRPPRRFEDYVQERAAAWTA